MWNHTRVSHLSIVGNMVAHVSWITSWSILSKHLPESPFELHAGWGIITMTFAARQISEQTVKQYQDLYMTFADLTKAFDTLNREGLWKMMSKCGCPDRFVKTIRQFQDGMMSWVLGDRNVWDPFGWWTEWSRAVSLPQHYSVSCSYRWWHMSSGKLPPPSPSRTGTTGNYLIFVVCQLSPKSSTVWSETSLLITVRLVQKKKKKKTGDAAEGLVLLHLRQIWFYHQHQEESHGAPESKSTRQSSWPHFLWVWNMDHLHEDMKNNSSSSIISVFTVSPAGKTRFPTLRGWRERGSRASSPPCVRLKPTGNVMSLKCLTHESLSNFSSVNYIMAEEKSEDCVITTNTP